MLPLCRIRNILNKSGRTVMAEKEEIRKPTHARPGLKAHGAGRGNTKPACVSSSLEIFLCPSVIHHLRHLFRWCVDLFRIYIIQNTISDFPSPFAFVTHRVAAGEVVATGATAYRDCTEVARRGDATLIFSFPRQCAFDSLKPGSDVIQSFFRALCRLWLLLRDDKSGSGQEESHPKQ